MPHDPTNACPGLGRLAADATAMQVIADYEADLRNEMQHWVLQRDEPGSPPLTPALQALLVKGFHNIIGGFAEAASAPVQSFSNQHNIERYKHWLRLPHEKKIITNSSLNIPALVRDVRALWLEQALLESEELQALPPAQAEQVAVRLTGSIIKRAVQVGYHLRIPDNCIRYTLIGPTRGDYLDGLGQSPAGPSR
jgi:hypothetical protein